MLHDTSPQQQPDDAVMDCTAKDSSGPVPALVQLAAHSSVQVVNSVELPIKEQTVFLMHLASTLNRLLKCRLKSSISPCVTERLTPGL